MCAAPTQLSTADSGLTYTFATVPVAVVELTDGKGGRPLSLGPYYDPTTEFTWEGESTIRMARNVARTFSGGIWARWVAQPGAVDGSTQPTLPTQFRLLLVPRSAVLFASAGGYREATPYLREEQKIWAGDPNIAGDTGILGALKKKAWLQTGFGYVGTVPFWRAGTMG